SDTNEEIIAAYRVIKESPEELIRLLSRLKAEYESAVDKGAYFYQKRDWRPLDRIEAAARLIFLNKTCYNGLYRVNSKGEFNVPFGRYKNPRILNSDVIRAASHVLENTKAELRSIDYKDALAPCGKADFIYLDPPYQPPTKTSSFTDYTPGGFSEKDQKELAEEFGKLVDRGCTVVLSNSETSLTRHLYDDFEIWKDGCSSRAELYRRRGRDNGNSRPEWVWENNSPNDPLYDPQANIWHRESDGDRCCRGGHEGSRGYGNRLSASSRVLASQAF